MANLWRGYTQFSGGQVSDEEGAGKREDMQDMQECKGEHIAR